MAVSDYSDSLDLLSDGSGSFSAPPYYNGAFSTGSIQFTHSSGQIQRASSGWGSFAWGTQFGPDSILGALIGQVGEMELEIRGKDMGSGSTWDAYSLYFNGTTGWELYRTINGSPSAALATATQSLSAGDLLAFLALGSGATVSLAAAIKSGGSWGADFLTYSDTNAARLVNSGYIGAWANGTTFKIDELYGGDAAPNSGGGGPAPTVQAPFTKMLMGVGL